jgi:hypothetical protein
MTRTECDDLSNESKEQSTGLTQLSDPVNHPAHYTQGGIECIEAIKAALGSEGFRAYCRGNVLKYLWRTEFKNGAQDLQKAKWYLDRLNEES